jgi:secondary thiamine-phosphate synthase enzyme
MYYFVLQLAEQCGQEKIPAQAELGRGTLWNHLPLQISWQLCLTIPVRNSMKVTTEYLKFHTKKHREYIHITPQVEAIVKKSGIEEGMVLVSAMHITAGIYVNDNESGLIEDIDQWLEKLAPFRQEYRHHQTGEDNGDSHLKALLIHHEVMVPITAGKLDFGTWQRIFYAEFDGQRDKRVIVKVMGE